MLIAAILDHQALLAPPSRIDVVLPRIHRDTKGLANTRAGGGPMSPGSLIPPGDPHRARGPVFYVWCDTCALGSEKDRDLDTCPWNSRHRARQVRVLLRCDVCDRTFERLFQKLPRCPKAVSDYDHPLTVVEYFPYD
ncbi:hypothetical protein Hesp01_15360 [Herbidospora sp. NBRC 101105]|nr:hypothetical protein Hesp01_15360 [Herbidospora sp. NBRC 101105]